MTLTKRESEVLALVAEGGSNKSIAAALGLSDHTIKFHIDHVIKKLKAKNRTHAAVLWTRNQERSV